MNVNALSNEIIGALTWTISEGYLPSAGSGNGTRPRGEEAICLLNAGGAHADVEMTILFGDRDPAGPYRLVVPALRLLRVHFREFEDPEPIPLDTPFAAVIESDEPVVVHSAFAQPANWVHFLSALPQTQTLS